jgi:hypothetical protein
MQHMKNKSFKDVKSWTIQNSNNDISKIYRQIYEKLSISLVPETLPSAIILLADYQYKNSFVADSELNLLACLIEIMAECEFI